MSAKRNLESGRSPMAGGETKKLSSWKESGNRLRDRRGGEAVHLVWLCPQWLPGPGQMALMVSHWKALLAIKH